MLKKTKNDIESFAYSTIQTCNESYILGNSYWRQSILDDFAYTCTVKVNPPRLQTTYESIHCEDELIETRVLCIEPAPSEKRNAMKETND